MAIVYQQQSWAAGNSLFTSVNNYNRADDGTDPLYPEVVNAEAVTVAGGRLDWNGTFGDYAGSGVHLDGFSAFSAETGFVTCRYRPNATSLTGYMGINGPYFNFVTVRRDIGGSRDAIEFHYDGTGGNDTLYLASMFGHANGIYENVAAPAWVADQEYTFKICWRCGTHDASFTSVAADGYVRFYIDDVLIHEFLNLPLSLTQTGSVNTVEELWFGNPDFFGALDQIEFNDATCDPPTGSEPCLCIPMPRPGRPPGGTSPGTPPSTLPPVIGTQALCDGGGLVPTQADVMSPEAWWYA